MPSLYKLRYQRQLSSSSPLHIISLLIWINTFTVIRIFKSIWVIGVFRVIRTTYTFRVFRVPITRVLRVIWGKWLFWCASRVFWVFQAAWTFVSFVPLPVWLLRLLFLFVFPFSPSLISMLCHVSVLFMFCLCVKFSCLSPSCLTLHWVLCIQCCFPLSC